MHAYICDAGEFIGCLLLFLGILEEHRLGDVSLSAASSEDSYSDAVAAQGIGEHR